MSTDNWRRRLQGLLDEHRRSQAELAAAGQRRDRVETARAWHALLVDNGLAGPAWPQSAGGMQLSLEDQLDYYRMTTAAGAPPHPCPISFIVAATLIEHGTSEQQQRFLQPLLRADEFWCQGFSEPGAGSDLASLSTRAVRDGDIYRVTGQKVWTTMADRADWMFALVRTGPAGRSTDGITYLLLPMDAPGLTVRPLHDISGAAHFAEVFFDDVEVPVDNRVGDEGEGWSIMRTSLGHERATAFLADEFKYRRTADQVISTLLSRGLGADPLVRQDIARIEAGVRTVAANSARALSVLLRGEDPGGVASVNRLVKSEFEQHLHRLGLRAVGPYTALGSRDPEAREKGRWTYGYLMSRAATIGAGTAEIQRNTIAETVLGLPSHRGEATRTAAVTPGAPLAVSDDEAALRQVLTKALAHAVDISAVLNPKRLTDAWDRELWSALVGFGLPGISTDESLGGSGAPRRLLYAALEEAAKALAPVPLVASVIALEIAEFFGAVQAAERIVRGTPASFVIPTGDDGWVTTGADLPQWDGARLTGRVPLVPAVPVAQLLLVLARASDDTPILLEVDPTHDAVAVTAHRPLDLTTTIGSVTFDAAVGDVLAHGSDLLDGLSRVQRTARLAVTADALGVGSRALAQAVAWAGERHQFGRPIGSFQAVAHRCADMLVALEGARSLLVTAAHVSPDAPEAEMLSALAASAAFEAAIAASEGAIQIHGGIGFTWEHPLHLMLRRAQSDAVLIGRSELLRDTAARALIATFDQ